MGFFSNLFQKKQPKTLLEELAEDHPLKWYSSSDATILLGKLCMRLTEPEDRRDILSLWISGYFGEFENIKELRMHEVFVATGVLSDFTAMLFENEAEKYDTVARKVAFGKKYIFDETVNPYVRFAQKLNHQFFGEGAKLVCKLIYLGYVDVDNATWLYDKALFAPVPNDTEDGEKLCEKISDFLYENGIVTDKILKEVGELV